MATAGAKSEDFQLVNVGTLELEDDGQYPGYTSIVLLSRDLLLVIDSEAYTLRLHNLHNGRILATSGRMESAPWDVCVVREMEVAVTLRSGQIEILSVEHTDWSASLIRVRSLNVTREFDRCHGVRTLRFTQNLVVSGVTLDKWICWGLVSHVDGCISTIYKICEYGELGSSYLTTSINDSTVYISCRASSFSPDNGVYAFDIVTGKKRFVYHPRDLTYPRGISVDARGFIYVCNNWHHPSIHQLTEKGEPVTVYREGMPPGPWAMYWQKEQGLIYVTSFGSKTVWWFCPQWSDQKDSVIPLEILRMDDRSVQLYKEALREGKEKVYDIRVMVVGQFGVGKTTLIKRLLGQQVDISARNNTEGIDVHKHCCKLSLDTGEWTVRHEDSDQLFRLQRLLKLLKDLAEKPEVSGEQKEHREVIYQRSTTPEELHGPFHYSDNDSDIPTSSVLDFHQEVDITLNQPEESSFVKVVQRLSALEGSSVSILGSGRHVTSKGDATMDILYLLKKNADKLMMSIHEYAKLSMWDFAGQYVFYTTHQAFLTRRAIYLLVADISQQVTDLVRNDEYYFDAAGARLCRVQDLVELGLNSIHCCAPSPSAGILATHLAADNSVTFPDVSIPVTPPVILVGTHVDTIGEDKRQEVTNMYFRQICHILKDKPTLSHLVDFFPIDNTQIDPQLETLKRRIFQLTSQQPYWGEEVPANWLPLEEALMKLKASGVKVIPFSFVVELNKAASVPINTAAQLDLFLRFLHETGTILYFSVEGLRETIVLDLQWLIDALKSLMTAEMFILKNNPAIRDKWFEFREKGKLTLELIDAIWTKEKTPEFHDNKNHILCLMEKLNIIARPGYYSEDAEEVKVEDYFLAPFMLHQATPKELISPEADTQLDSTSSLCFVFTGKFLPVPVFHRLLASCVAHWPIAKQRSMNLIFCGCCVFDLDLHHRLIMHFKDYAIFVKVIQMGATEICQLSKLCIEARKFISENITKIIGNMGQSLQFELHVKCPDSDADSLDGLVAVSLLKKNEIVPCHSHDKSHTLVSHKLLQFWFEEKETSSEADPYPIIPMEILRMDEKSLQLYKEALRDGKEKVYNIRVMVVGQYHVGKTTLAKRLLGKQVDISLRKSTEGIDVYKHCCRVSLETGEWISQVEDSDQLSRLQRLMKILSDQAERPEISSENEGHREVIYQRETTPEELNGRIHCNGNDVDILASSVSDFHQEVVTCSDQPEESFFVKTDQRHVTSNSDAMMSVLQLLNKNADKLEKSIKKFAALSMWDFAGQYVFYSTHQTFLTSRAIYLLVSDLSQQITDLVSDDECYFDTEGVRLCQVQDLVEVWLNSIHCCAPSSAAGTPDTPHAASTTVTSLDMYNQVAPPVILVGTHVDKIPEDKCQQVTSMYFQQVCRILKDKPTRFHLVDFFAIDNTQFDPQLEALKRRILELASKQPYWGEEVPSNWIVLEEALMKLKASGKKVISLRLVEELNETGCVPIKTSEGLDLFLRFQHELGTILYFSVEGLRERIVLDPQWFIDAQKSLITAPMFILMRSPAIMDKWFEFRDKGKLTPELIDAIWTKQLNPDFHDNKEHILLLMEKFNIVARASLYSENEDVIKMEDYFLAPCMLHRSTPREIICPEPHAQMESSSVLCYVFVGKFLPSPIFHRLLAACVAHWPIATKKREETQETLIFCGCCVFQLDQYHKLTLHFRDYVIFMRLTKMGITDKTPSSNMCIESREFVTAMLVKIIGYLGQSLKFEHFIQCPEYCGDSVNSLIPVSLLRENKQVCCDFHDHIIESERLLKFWFKDVIPNLDKESFYYKAENQTALSLDNLNETQLLETLIYNLCPNTLGQETVSITSAPNLLS